MVTNVKHHQSELTKSNVYYFLQELRYHLLHYKQADLTGKFGMEFYEELPPIRQNYIDSLDHT